MNLLHLKLKKWRENKIQKLKEEEKIQKLREIELQMKNVL